MLCRKRCRLHLHCRATRLMYRAQFRLKACTEIYLAFVITSSLMFDVSGRIRTADIVVSLACRTKFTSPRRTIDLIEAGEEQPFFINCILMKEYVPVYLTTGWFFSASSIIVQIKQPRRWWYTPPHTLMVCLSKKKWIFVFTTQANTWTDHGRNRSWGPVYLRHNSRMELRKSVFSSYHYRKKWDSFTLRHRI